MYIPSPFLVSERSEVLAFIERNPFGTLISSNNGKLLATHAPVLMRVEGDTVVFFTHLARANPQHEDIEGSEALITFLGPHAYVSPAWYASRKNVPTWDYAAAHVYGGVSVVEDAVEVVEFLSELTDVFEGRRKSRWSVDELDASLLHRMAQEIVVLRIVSTRIEGAYKLSQNRQIEDRLGVVKGLMETGRTMDASVAQLMLKDPALR